MKSWEGWNSLEMNQRLRAIQPDLIINNRSHLDEDFGTPEGHVSAMNDRDWEACMTFNDLSWGYVDAAQAGPYSYNAQRILKMLATCAGNCGNLLLNIGPAPDGSAPPEAVEPLTAVGKWLTQYGECAYGKVDRVSTNWGYGSGICSISVKGNTVYLWNWIWPKSGDFVAGGFTTKLKSAKVLGSGVNLKFTQEKYRIIFSDVPREPQDKIAGVAVIALEFEGKPEMVSFPARPPLNDGKIYS
jgi:alpha-L-fucosidase